MPNIVTPWGYEVASLPALMTETEFNAATGNKYVDMPSTQIGFAISAASGAVRDICGWHVCPSLSCKATLTAGDEWTGERTRIVALPASYVSGISSVTEDGTVLQSGQYAAMQNGLIRRTGWQAWSGAWGGVVVEYTAGYEAEAVPSFMGAVVSIIEAALSVPVGVSSETAGGVSISYTAEMGAMAAITAQRYSQAFMPYRVVNIHAA